jgi:hypothetical protein
LVFVVVRFDGLRMLFHREGFLFLRHFALNSVLSPVACMALGKRL